MGVQPLERESRYVDQYAEATVTITHLRIVVVVLSLVVLSLTSLCGYMYFWSKNQRPLVVRISEVGQAQAVDAGSLNYEPQDKELRHFLGQFVQQHFERQVATIQDHYWKSLYFVDRRLSQGLVEEERLHHNIANFIRDTNEENEVVLRNIVLQDLHTSPMKASVDFEKVFYNRGDRQELRRERYVGSFEFVVAKDIPNDFIPINPLGLVITYYRVDAAFK